MKKGDFMATTKIVIGPFMLTNKKCIENMIKERQAQKEKLCNEIQTLKNVLEDLKNVDGTNFE